MAPHPPDRTRRRSPTSDDLRIWREFVETGDLLRSSLAARLQSESELSTGDYTVLLSLSEAEGRRRRSSTLAERIGWKRSRLSHHLRRMEDRGLIRREECADDSRGTEIVLTREGSERFRRASAPHLRAVQELFVGALDPELMIKVDEVTRALRAHLATTGRAAPPHVD